MLSADEIMQLVGSLIWLLAGVGVFIVGMNFMSDALEKSAGEGMKRLLGKISNNRFSGVGIGAGVTAIIQSSSATSVMVIGLVNAGVMTLMQATPIIMGANIGTTITGVLVALKNDYFVGNSATGGLGGAIRNSGTIKMATQPALKPLLYKFNPPYMEEVHITIAPCSIPANTPATGPN